MLSTSTEGTRNEADVEARPDVIQNPEENEIIKTTSEELKVVILFVHWPDKKVYVGQT